MIVAVLHSYHMQSGPLSLILTLNHLQVISEAQKWCNSVSGGTEIPALLSLADAALSQFVTSLQARSLTL